MAGGNVIFYIFLAIMIVLLIRWSIRVFFTDPKIVTSAVQEPRRRRTPSEVFPSVFFIFKLMAWCRSEYCKRPASGNNTRSNVRRTTVYTINADPRGNDPPSNFTDFFWDVSPQTSSARNEPAKDDKDLPSYDEVMQMEMRQQVIGAAATTATATTASVTSLTPATPLTPLTPVTPLTIAPVTVASSTV